MKPASGRDLALSAATVLKMNCLCSASLLLHLDIACYCFGGIEAELLLETVFAFEPCLRCASRQAAAETGFCPGGSTQARRRRLPITDLASRLRRRFRACLPMSVCKCPEYRACREEKGSLQTRSLPDTPSPLHRLATWSGWPPRRRVKNNHAIPKPRSRHGTVLRPSWPLVWARTRCTKTE